MKEVTTVTNISVTITVPWEDEGTEESSFFVIFYFLTIMYCSNGIFLLCIDAVAQDTHKPLLLILNIS